MKLTRAYYAAVLWGMLALAAPPDVADLRRAFASPPDDARIMMRWWWFGPAVTKAELEREMRTMKEGGIGGFEVQPVYPLALDDPEQGFRNLPYLSGEFIDALRFTNDQARALGLRVDLTLGSGWPFGGPHIPVTQAAGRLRCDRLPVPAGAQNMPLPDIGNGEKLIAVFLARGDRKQFDARGMRRLFDIAAGMVKLPADREGPHVAMFFISSRAGMQVKRPSVNAEGFVLDHYNRAALDRHLKTVGDRLLQAFGPHPPYAVFSDSLEVFSSDWTDDLPQEFHKRRGYDLTPYLPALIGDIGDKTASVRHDWGQTLTELADERYLEPLRAWAHAHGTRLRSQTYGTPPVVLSSSALVDLPEGEGPHWRSFSTARWAASASHLYGRPVTSSETWTWLHSGAFRATPLDMKAEADLHFLQGINQLIGHGWPYSPESAGRPGWRFYAAAAFNDHNPWWIVMPDVARYLQRVSFLLRQGKPANDVAIYLPTDDAWSQFTAGRDSIDRSMDGLLGATLIPQILDAGYNFDFIDDRAIERAGVQYPILILPGVERIPPATIEKLQAYTQKGGIVVATRRVPALAAGLIQARGRLIRDESSLGRELPGMLAPDFATGSPAIGFVHRKLDSGEIYFVVNTSNQPVHTKAAVRVTGLTPEWWDPFTGEATPAGASLSLDFEPYESRVLVFSAGSKAEPSRAASPPTSLDISTGWKVSFSGLSHTVQMDRLRSWTDEEETRYFSGTATYEKSIAVPEMFVKAGIRVALNFGEGTPVAPGRGQGMRALLENPVREAAVVYVNGAAAGSVWRPPYEVDVTKLLRAGRNEIRVMAGNLAINAMAGRPLPDYRLLNLRYGERFTPQGLENLQPLPAGVLGPVRLIAR
jgi:hypothetical protein